MAKRPTEEWETDNDAYRWTPPADQPEKRVRSMFEVVWTGYYHEAVDGGHLVADHCGYCQEWGHESSACPEAYG